VAAVDPIGEKEGDTTMSNEKEQRMGRRDFFVTAGKLIIPTLGVLGLSLAISDKAQAAGCKTVRAPAPGAVLDRAPPLGEGWAKGMVK